MTSPAPGDDATVARPPIGRTFARVRPLTAVAVGTLGIIAVVGVLIPLGDGPSRTVHALLLLIPVIIAGLLGGRVAAVAVSVEAAGAFGMFLEPVGSPAIHLQSELVALVVFVLVAAATGVLVATVVNTERQRVAADQDRIETLERSEQQRKALLRSVSHDLRTPLATIRAAAEELHHDGIDYDEADRDELLAMVLSETERLDRIVANLLSLNRVEAGALLPDRRPVRLDEVVRSSVDRLQTMLASRTVAIDVAGEVPTVELDRSQMDQVMTNLLENACRHSPPASTITITIRALDRGVEVVVADEGSGFPPDSADKLFQPFAMATGAGSSGIGLAICRSIIEAHGGTITAANGPVGGAVVALTLPAG